MDPMIYHIPETVPEEEQLTVREEVVEQDFVFEEIFEIPEIADITYTLQNILDVGGVGNSLSSTSYDEKEMTRYSSGKSDSEEESNYGEPSPTRLLFQFEEHSKGPTSDQEMNPSMHREDSFTCDICFNSFPKKESLVRHRRTHEEPHLETYGICFVCGIKFNNVHSLKKHEENHAADALTETRKHDTNAKDESFICDVCNKTFSSMNNLTLHMCTFPNAKTSTCNTKEISTTNVFSQECDLVMNQTGESEKSYCCDICGMTFQQKRFLKYHKLMHTGEKTHTCKKCGAAFARRSSLKIHSLTHTQEKAITCEDCKKVFCKSSHLYKHQQVNTEEKPHTCKKCGEAFARATCMKHHKRIHKEKKPFPCNVCKTTVYTMDELVSHMHSHNDEESSTSNTPSETVHKESELDEVMAEQSKQIYCTCGICKETFASPDSFKNHKCTDDAQKTFTCKTCNKSFSKRSSLATHQRVHTAKKEKKSYVCEECDKSFNSPAGLRGHALSHKKKKVRKSETCRKTSPPQSKRTGQIQQSTTKKMHHCNNCSKEFSTKSHLTRHLNSVHTNQKRRAYEKKTTRATSSANADKGRTAQPKQKTIRSTTTRTEGNETTAQPSEQVEENYSCNHCSKNFSRKLSLTKHLQQHTGDNAFSCESCPKA